MRYGFKDFSNEYAVLNDCFATAACQKKDVLNTQPVSTVKRHIPIHATTKLWGKKNRDQVQTSYLRC